MKRCLLYLIPYTFCLLPAFAQNAAKPYYPYPKPFPPDYHPSDKADSSGYFNPKLMHPVIGIGSGILTFYGDVSAQRTMPSISRVGYNLSVSEYLSRSILFSARALFGTLGANEKGARSMNFESSMRLGGVNVVYNFDHFLSPKRRIDPFLLSGFEYFEYLSKTDLFDAYGNQYHYWSDGSIMSMDETNPNAGNAIPLIRDYNYETDIRKWNNSLFGKYPERSFAVPVGAGVNLHLTPRWTFKLGAAMHFSFTDYMDGVKPQKGSEKGNNRKDKFLETYFTLTFNLFNPKPPYLSPLTDDEFLALLNEDTDGDGITDFNDSCQGTPPGVPVNAKGCPADSDNDALPDYADKEINSPLGGYVDKDGVAMDDSTIARNWRIWSDSTVAYNTITNPPAVASERGWGNPARDATIVFRRELVILLGIYKEGIPPDEMGKLLNVPDVRSFMQPDATTVYTAGSYNRPSDAEKRKKEMIGSGFANAKVMVRYKDGSLAPPPPEGGNAGDASAVILLGIYKEGIPPDEMGKLLNVPDVRSFMQPDATTAYTAGSYNSPSDAEERKKEMIRSGFANAKVMVRNKDGSLSEPTQVPPPPEGGNAEDASALIPPSGGGGASVIYRVQLGAYSKKLSSSVFKNAGQMVVLKTEDGLYKYITGGFHSIQDALEEREELVKKGYSSAFVVAYKGGKRVPLSSVSGGIVQPKDESMEDTKTPSSALDKNLISFRIQIGSFAGEPPPDIMQKFNKVPGLEKKKKPSGITRYFAGKFNNYHEAQKFKEEVVNRYGIADAFMVAYFKNQLISVQEAVELLK